MPGVTEDIKRGQNLCCCVGGKMFLVLGLGQVPVTASFKVSPEEFAEMSMRTGFAPAPYLARHHWVLTENIGHLRREEWEARTRLSYELVASGLPKKVQQTLKLA